MVPRASENSFMDILSIFNDPAKHKASCLCSHRVSDSKQKIHVAFPSHRGSLGLGSGDWGWGQSPVSREPALEGQG